MNKDIFDVKLNAYELASALETSEASFNLMLTTFGNDPLELIKYTLYIIECLNKKLYKIMEEFEK